MKSKILAAVLITLALSGCGVLSNTFKHLHSSVTGLDREIILYSGNGQIIKSWRTTAKVEDRGGTCFFIANGKAVTISGTFIIEEQ